MSAHKGSLALLQNILVIKTRSIGDNIVMLPALRLLKAKCPDAEIDVLTAAESAPPLKSLSLIGTVHCFRKKAGVVRRILDTLRVLYTIRKKRFDLVINLQASTGSEMLSVLSGARKRLIYPYIYGKRSRFSTYHVCKPKKAKQTVLEDIEALRPLGIPTEVPQFAYPLASGSKRKAHALLQDRNIQAKKFIVLHPGGGDREKLWSASHFGALIDMIVGELSLGTVVLFTGAEELRFRDIAEAACTDPIGLSVPFDVLAAVIEMSRAFIGSDSAPHHIACALDIPSIVLMPRDRRATWHPYDVQRHRVLIGTQGGEPGKGVDTITPETVFITLQQLMAITDPS